MSIPRKEAGTEVPPMGLVPSTDYIVPHYTEEGRRTRQGIAAGGATAENAIKQKMIQSMLRKGGEPLETQTVKETVIQHLTTPTPVKAVKGKKGKKEKAVKVNIPIKFEQDIPAPNYAEVSKPKPNVVVFNLQSGKMKVVVDAILETEIGLCLVFSNDEEVRFVPEQGNELTITLPGNKDVTVMYLGLQFNWYNSSQQLLTFIKMEAE